MMARTLACLFVCLLLTFVNAQGRANGQINDALNSFFGEGGDANVTAEQVAAVDASQFEYSYDRDVTPQVHEQILSAFSAPEDRALIADALNQLTLEQQQAIMDSGFPDGNWSATNLVDVIAASVVSAYGILQNLENTTPQQDAAVRDLFRVAFADTQLPELSNADKQLVTESLLLATILSVVQYEQARQEQGVALTDVQDGARQTLQAFGLDPRFFTLGASGLEATPAAQQVADGELSVEQAFPELAAELAASGAEPVLPSANAVSADAPTSPATGATPADATDTAPNDPLPTSPTPTDPASATPDVAPANPLGAAPANPLAAPDVFSGSFSDGMLTLTLVGTQAAYTGTLELNGESLPVEASADGMTLTGSFISGGASFAFEATLAGETLTLESDGNTFTLQKAAPSNPLGN